MDEASTKYRPIKLGKPALSRCFGNLSGNLLLFSVDESETKTITTVQLVDSSEDIVDEVVVECDLTFSASHDQVMKQTTIVGHVGKNAVMTFLDSGITNAIFSSLS